MRGFLFIFLVLSNLLQLKAQPPRLVLPVGHTAAVIKTEFSPDGKYVATISLDGAVKLWESSTGMLIKDFRISGDASIIMASDAGFSKDGKLLVILYEGNNFSVYRMTDGLPFEPETESGTLSHLIDPPQRTDLLHILQMFSGDSRSFIYGWGVGDPEVFNVETGKKQLSIKGVEKENQINQVFYTADSKKILIISDKNILHICNAVNGTVIKKIKLKKQFAEFELLGDNQSILCIPDSYASSEKFEVLNFITGKYWALTGAGTASFFKLNPDGTKLALLSGAIQTGEEKERLNGLLDAVVYYDSLLMWDLKSRKKIIQSQGDSTLLAARNEDLFNDSGDKLLLPGAGSRFKVLDVATGKEIFQRNGGEGYLSKAVFSKDAKQILTLTNGREINLWNAQNGIKEFELTSATDSLADVAFSPNNQKIAGSTTEGKALIWDIKTGKLSTSIKGYTNNYISARLSKDNKKLLLYSTTATKTVDLISGEMSVDSSNFFQSDISGIVVDSISFEGKTTISREMFNQFLVKSSQYKTSPDSLIQICNYGVNLLFLCPYGYANAEISSNSSFSKIPRDNFSSFEIINDAQFSADSKKLIITYENSFVSIFDITTGQYLFSYIDIGKDDYLIIDTTTGYYKGTTGAARKLHYVASQNKVITFEQLDVKYNRPDLLLKKIGIGDSVLIRSFKNAYDKRIRKLGIDASSFQNGLTMPEADITNRNSISYEQQLEKLEIKIKAVDKLFPLQRFNVLINGVPVYGMQGIYIGDNKRKSFDTSLTVTLASGENSIAVSVINSNGIENYRFPLAVKLVKTNQPIPRVFFAGIGVNRFADSSFNLRWCVQDIRDLAKKFSEKYGKQFILVDTLFDENVSKEAVQRIKTKLLQTEVNDKVIIAFSGHGLLSDSLDYYLSAFQTNFKKPETGGIPYDVMEDLLDSIPARKKLLLLDACHSGEVDKEDASMIKAETQTLAKQNISVHTGTKGGIVTNLESAESKMGLQNSFDLMQTLFANVGKSTGATVISASGGVQLAQERSDLGHGVFTFSIIEALNAFNTISISALQKYVSDKVLKLTKGLQKPTTRSETLLFDWNLW